MGAIGTSGVAGASSSSTSDSTDPHIEEDNWKEAMEEVNQQHYSESSSSYSIGTQGVAIPAEPPTIPNPKDVPFDVCTTLPSGNSLCVRSFTKIAPVYMDCADRRIMRVGMDVFKHNITWNGELHLEWSMSYWVGIDKYGCVWIGINSAQQTMCSRVECNLPSQPNTINDFPFADIVNDFIDTLAGNTHLSASDTETVTTVAVGGAGAYLALKSQLFPEP